MFLFFAVTVKCFLLVSYPKQWRIQDIEVALLYQIGEKLKEKGKQQESDVHIIHVGIGRDHNAVVAQVFNAIVGSGMGEDDSVAALKLLEKLSTPV